MKTQTIITSAIAGILLASISLFIIKLIYKRNIKNNESFFNTSSVVWIISLIISMALLLDKTIIVFSEAVSIIFLKDKGVYSELIKIFSLYAGICFSWFFILYRLVIVLRVFILGNKNDKIEIEQNNVNHFLINGALLILFVYCLLSVFESLLRTFIIQVDVPIYH